MADERTARYEAVQAYLAPVDGFTLVTLPGSDLFGYSLQSCNECSALVSDVENHAKFHAALSVMPAKPPGSPGDGEDGPW